MGTSAVIARLLSVSGCVADAPRLPRCLAPYKGGHTFALEVFWHRLSRLARGTWVEGCSGYRGHLYRRGCFVARAYPRNDSVCDGTEHDRDGDRYRYREQRILRQCCADECADARVVTGPRHARDGGER